MKLNVIALAAFAGFICLSPSRAQDDAWTATASDDVSASLAKSEDNALRLEFNFNGVAGYAVARRDLRLSLPSNYALNFKVKGDGPANDLQIKFVDESGDNVWWYRLPLYKPSSGWQEISIYKEDIEFAWGPTEDRAFKGFTTIEIVVAAGYGGQGWLAIDDFEIKPLPEGVRRTVQKTLDPNTIIMEKAAASPRGTYPRAFHGEQSYWTLVGEDGGDISALLSEDGAFELAKGSFSIEPFVEYKSKRFTWADVEISHSLMDDYLPIPSVHWAHPDWDLTITTFAYDGKAIALYRLHNKTDASLSARLALDIRPFQVNPPTQFLNTKGGVSPVTDITSLDGAVRVNDDITVWPSQSPQATPLTFTLDVQPGKTETVGYSTFGDAALSLSELEATLNTTAQQWREKLNRVQFSGPPAAKPALDTLRSALAQMLMSRDGPSLQPGTRSYNRSWIRDGAMMGEALLRLGHSDIASDYLHWYADYQFSTGKIPCCVDWRGADPVPENDSDGEFIFLAREIYRYGGDEAMARELWRPIKRAFIHMESLRAQERHDGNPLHLYGLMPPSISHEGYSAKPAYSYWDNFWALRGYKDAASLALALSDQEAASAMIKARDEFRTDLLASIKASVREHGIDYIPGAADLGDFDATSTTIALAPGGAMPVLPRVLLDNTFKRYWQQFKARRDGSLDWDVYTPYELRNVSAFVRLGWREKAHKLLDFFMNDRRPAAWNQWAEVVGRNPRTPRFVGDMPHGWIASDYIRAILDMFAYEDEHRQALIIGAGLPNNWLSGDGVTVQDLYTPFGVLNMSIKENDGQIAVALTGTASPPGGFILHLPQVGERHVDTLPFHSTLEKTP